jgi:hypothetical protein
MPSAPSAAAAPITGAWDDQEYQAVAARKVSLQLELKAVEDRIAKAIEPKPERESLLKQRARARALGMPEPAAGDISVNMAELHREREVAEAAVSEVEHLRLEAEEAASRRVMAKAWPEYRKIIARQLDAARKLQTILDEEDVFIGRLLNLGTRLGPFQRVLFLKAEEARFCLDRLEREAEADAKISV